jgi:prepilin-type N-terminal cleavage/methylation domain-containing protein
MRAHRGFTLLELMVVVAIIGIVTAIVIRQGRSAGRNADIAGGTYELALRIQGLRGRALSEGRDHLLVVVDAEDRTGCERARLRCARYFHLLPRAGVPFDVTAFDPAAPGAMADYDDDRSAFLPKGVRLDLAPAWQPPPPFNAVVSWDPAIRTNCAGGRACFALRFTGRGDVEPEPRPAAIPGGFAFAFEPVIRANWAGERRALFVSFPAGIVKTAAY